MTILDPAPSTTRFGVDRTLLSTPFADETEDRAILDFDALFAGWNDFDRLSQLTPILSSGVHRAGEFLDLAAGDSRMIADLFLTMEPSAVSDDNRDGDRLYEHLRRVETGFNTHLNEALQELDSVDRHLEENALPLPSAEARSNARTLIPRLCRLYHHGFAVYPLFDGEIAIEATVASRHSVLFSCEPDGSVLCLVNIRQRRRRAKYHDASELPDRFICDALTELSELRDIEG